jgi:GntR family transcriptional regulator
MIPLYFRVESFIRSKILSGQFEPGARLPTEDEFIRNFGVSRITIRNALSHLQKQGLISKHRSKGTFVAEDIVTQKQSFFTGEVRDLILDARGYKTQPLSIHTQCIESTKFPKILSNFFRLTRKDEITSVKRLRLSDNVPVYYVENFILPETANHFTLKELNEKTVLEILKEKIALTIGRGEMHIEASPAEPEIAQILKCGTFDPVIFVQTYYWYSSGEPFEIVNRYVRAEFFKFKIEIDPVGHKPV